MVFLDIDFEHVAVAQGFVYIHFENVAVAKVLGLLENRKLFELIIIMQSRFDNVRQFSPTPGVKVMERYKDV